MHCGPLLTLQFPSGTTKGTPNPLGVTEAIALPDPKGERHLKPKVSVVSLHSFHFQSLSIKDVSTSLFGYGFWKVAQEVYNETHRGMGWGAGGRLSSEQKTLVSLQTLANIMCQYHPTFSFFRSKSL